MAGLCISYRNWVGTLRHAIVLHAATSRLLGAAQKRLGEGKTQDKPSMAYVVDRAITGQIGCCSTNHFVYPWTNHSVKCQLKGQTPGDIILFTSKNGRIIAINGIRRYFNSIFSLLILSYYVWDILLYVLYSFSSSLLLPHSLNCFKFHVGHFHTISNERNRRWKRYILAVPKRNEGSLWYLS